MSGIINSSGARSGIVGETEIEGLVYEEGTWTGGIPNVGGPTVVKEYYRRIGNVVFVFGRLVFASVTGNTAHGVGISGLPFASKENDIFGGTDNGPHYYSSGNFKENGYHVSSGKNLYMQVGQSDTSITIGEWSSDFLWSEFNFSSGSLDFQITYLCEGA